MAATENVLWHFWQYLNLLMEFGCQSKLKVWVSGLEEHNIDYYGVFERNKIVQKFKMAAILSKYTIFLNFSFFNVLESKRNKISAYSILYWYNN